MTLLHTSLLLYFAKPYIIISRSNYWFRSCIRTITMSNRTWTYEKHLAKGSFCKACRQVPWESLLSEAFAVHNAGSKNLKNSSNILSQHILHTNRTEFENASWKQRCVLCFQLFRKYMGYTASLDIPHDICVKMFAEDITPVKNK